MAWVCISLRMSDVGHLFTRSLATGMSLETSVRVLAHFKIALFVLLLLSCERFNLLWTPQTWAPAPTPDPPGSLLAGRLPHRMVAALK